MSKALGNTEGRSPSRTNSSAGVSETNMSSSATPVYTANGRLFSYMRENRLKLR